MTNPIAAIDSSDLRKGTTASALSAISYAVAVAFIRGAYDAGVSPGTAVFLRFAIASTALALFLTLARRWTPLSGRQVLVLFLLGFLIYTLLGVTWFVALSTTPAWLVSLITALAPLATAVGSRIFLGEMLNKQQRLALALVLLGGVALFWRPIESVAWVGVLLMLLNIILRVVYVLAGQRGTRDVPPVVSTVWMVTGAAVGTFIYTLGIGDLSLRFAPVGWVWIVLFALISTVIAIIFLWRSIELIGPTLSSIIGSLEPLFSVLLAVLVLGEGMAPPQIAGGVFILAGTVLVRVKRRA
jgi:drug/metabolite transporter (DMT)-like permease